MSEWFSQLDTAHYAPGTAIIHINYGAWCLLLSA